MTDYKNLKDVLVGDILHVASSGPARVAAGARLDDAIEAMTGGPVSRKVYVVDEGGVLVGTITLETILSRVGYIYYVSKPGMMSFFSFLGEILREDVADFMDKNPVRVTGKDRVLDALALMVEHHLNDLPVVDDKGVLTSELNGMEIVKRATSRQRGRSPQFM